MILDIPEDFTEALKVYDLPFAQEADGITYFRVFYHSENIIIGGAGFLFCCKIFKQICDGVTLWLKFTGIKGNAARCLGPDSGGMVKIVRTEAGFLDLLRR